jgi:phage-related minor tail protein
MANGDPDAGFDENLRTLNALEGAADRVGTALTRGLKAAALEGKSLDGVLKGVLTRLSSSVIDASLTPLSGLLSQLTSGLAGAIGGGLSGLFGGGVKAFADGGVISTPTYFPMGGGGTGLVGEAGAEAILPLARGADGALGVKSGGGAVNVTFNVTTQDAASFKRSEAQLTGMLARAVGRGRRGL